MRRFLPIVLAIVGLAFAASPASAARSQLAPQNRLEREVYNVYNRDCGGYNPWHHTYWKQLAWWCSNRNVELQTLNHTKWYRSGEVDYCYTESKVGSKKERCMDVELVWDRYQKQVIIGRMLAYWTNA